jgi:hypothetical protein
LGLNFALFLMLNLVALIIGVASFAVNVPIIYTFMWILAPLWVLFFAVSLLQWRIFGVITRQQLFGTYWAVPYEHDTWYTGCWLAFGTVVLTSPFYEELQRAFHIYWRRSIRCSFFAAGQDIELAECGRNDYCPNIIVGSIMNDFRRPTDRSRHSLFEMSSFFCGGARVGWLQLPRYLYMGRIIAISAAAVDGMLMFRNELISRWLIWALSFLSGDWIVWPGSEDLGSLGRWLGFRDMHVVKVLDALPGNALLLGAFALLLRASQLHEAIWHTDQCPQQDRAYVVVGVIVFVGTVIASFFTYAPAFAWLRGSPIIRQFQMLTKNHAIGLNAPKQVYLSDGGLIECLGLHNLLRRRCKRIIAFEATETGIVHIRSIIERCWELNRCSLFDPQNPRRDVRFLVDEFEQDQRTFLHVGVYYEDGTSGDLIFVVMRQLADAPVQAPVSGAELRAPAGQTPVPENGTQLTRLGLRGCCCQCCHTWVPFGAFPIIPTANQCITTAQASELARLAYELTGPALRHLLTCCNENAA